jgi:hypothetical protein
VSKNKLLTQDNLEKRRVVDTSCLFCAEKENVCHLLFECVVARMAWEVISEVVGVRLGQDYESIAKLWLCNTKFGVINIISSAVCWSIWKNEKFAMLSGSALDRHGAAVAEDDATDQMLEDFGSFEDGRRLRKCVLEDGE